MRGNEVFKRAVCALKSLWLQAGVELSREVSNEKRAQGCRVEAQDLGELLELGRWWFAEAALPIGNKLWRRIAKGRSQFNLSQATLDACFS
jgi:hypothetical protein